MLALGVDGLITRKRGVLIVAAALAGGLPFFIPFTRTITTSAVSDTFAMLPWWWVQDHLVSLGDIKWAALAVCLAAAALFVLLPRRFVLVLAGARRGVLPADGLRRRVRRPRDREDLARVVLGGHARAPSRLDRPPRRPQRERRRCSGRLRCRRRIPSGRTSSSTAASGRSTTSTASPTPGPAAGDRRESLDRRRPRRRPASPVHAAVRAREQHRRRRRHPDRRTTPLGINLYRVNGPIVILSHIGGLYPSDTWSGKTASYQRVECTGGSLTVRCRATTSSSSGRRRSSPRREAGSSAARRSRSARRRR